MNHRLDSRSLRLFLAVAETLSFREAAETLHMTQPPLSRGIRDLEGRLGALLFDRNTQSVNLTDAGRRLLPFARRMRTLLDQAYEAVASTPDVRRLRLGLTTAVEPQWFAGVMQHLQSGGSEPEVFTDPSPRLVQRLLRGQLHAAFIAWPTRAPGLQVDEVAREPLMAVLPSRHRLARRRLVSLADLAHEPVFWFKRSRQPAFHDHCQAVFRRHGFEPAWREEPPDHHMLLAAVSQGSGIALLPASFTTLRRPGVSYRPLREGEALQVGIGLATPPGQEALRSLLLEAAEASSGSRTLPACT